MYKYLLLERGRSIGTQPRGEKDWKDYDRKTYLPEYGVSAWGELYYDRQLTEQEVREYELFDCEREGGAT